MAKKNEAYIEFKARTDDFQKGIKEMNAQLKNASNELRLNSTELKGTGNNVELLTKRQNVLQQELEASANKVELTEKALAECKATLGENSKEYQNLNNAVLSAKNQQAAIQNELTQTAQKLQALENENKQAASSFGQLEDKISKQETELKDLKQAYANVVLEQGKNSDEAKKLSKQIGDLSGELSENKKKMNDAEDAADKFDKTLDDTSEKSEKLGGALKTAAVGFAAFVAGAVEAGKTAIDAFNEVDEGADNVIKATGATGKAATDLEQSYKNVASKIVGDFGDIGSALGEVNTRFGFTGTEAEKATEEFLKFSEITGVDATTAVQNVSKAIEGAGLKSSDYQSILDALTKASQVTGISTDTLSDSVNKNGAVMRAMGFDTYETIGMLAQFEKAGVNSQTVTKGMQKAVANWAKDGKNAKEEFAKMVEGIKNGSVTTTEVYETFGNKAGTELVDAIKSGRFAYEDMVKTVENSKGSLDNTFDETIDGGYKLEQAMQNAKIALGEVGGEIAEDVAPIADNFAKNVIPKISTAWQDVQKGFQWIKDNKAIVITAVTGLAAGFVALESAQIAAGIATAAQTAKQLLLNVAMNANPIGLVIMGITALVTAIMLLWNNCEGFRNFFINMGEKIKEAWNKTVDGIKTKIEEWKVKISTIKQSFDDMKTKVTSVITSIKDKVTSTFNAIKTAITNPVETAKNTVQKIVDKIKSAFNFKWSLPSLKLPHISVSGGVAPFGIGGKGSLPKFSIKWYAKGGLFDEPTILPNIKGFNGFGEAGKEYALPLNERTLTPLAVMLNKLQNNGNIADILTSRFDRAIDVLSERLEHIEAVAFIDGQAASEKLAGYNDDISGQRTALANRGLAL